MSTSKQRLGTSDPFNIHVGNKLRIARALYGFSQERLADRAGLQLKQIQEFEQGTREISIRQLHDFSIILTIPVEYFFLDYENPEPLKLH